MNKNEKIEVETFHWYSWLIYCFHYYFLIDHFETTIITMVMKINWLKWYRNGEFSSFHPILYFSYLHYIHSHCLLYIYIQLHLHRGIPEFEVIHRVSILSFLLFIALQHHFWILIIFNYISAFLLVNMNEKDLATRNVLVWFWFFIVIIWLYSNLYSTINLHITYIHSVLSSQ